MLRRHSTGFNGNFCFQPYHILDSDKHLLAGSKHYVRAIFIGLVVGHKLSTGGTGGHMSEVYIGRNLSAGN